MSGATGSSCSKGQTLDSAARSTGLNNATTCKQKMFPGKYFIYSVYQLILFASAFQNQGTFKSTYDYDYEDGNSLLDQFNGTLADDLTSDENIDKTGEKNDEKTEDKTGDKTIDKAGDKTSNKNSDRTGDKIVTGTSNRIKRDVEDVRQQSAPPFFVPRRANGASAQLGLQLILDPNIGYYSDSALNYNYGFKVVCKPCKHIVYQHTQKTCSLFPGVGA